MRPDRAVTLMVPFAAGSGTDAVARIVAPPLGEELRANVVVENRTGANGAIASVAAAKARPDGLTVLMATNTTHSANPALMRRLDYGPIRDFAPVARLGSINFVLVVGRHVPARTLPGVVSWAKARAGRFSYASANAIGAVGMAILARLAGFEAASAPYAGHRFPSGVVGHAAWLCFSFPPSLRMVGEVPAAPDVVVGHETVRR